MFRQRLLLVLLSMAALVATARLAHAQDEATMPDVSVEPIREGGYVLVDGGGHVSRETWNLAIKAIPRRMADALSAQAGGPPPPIHLFFASATGRLNQAMEPGSAEIYSLVLDWNPDQELSDEQQRQAWEMAREELENTIQSIQRMGHASQQRRLEESLERLAAQRDQLEQEVEQTLVEIADKGTSPHGSPQQIDEALTESQQRLRELELDLIGMTARQTATEHRIDELRAATAQSKSDDPILKELSALVEIRSRSLERVQVLESTGQVTQSGVNDAEAALAEARVEHFREERTVVDRSGGQLLRSLNDKLSELIVQTAEFTAQRDALSERVEQLRHEMSDSRRLTAETEHRQQRLSILRARQQEVERTLAQRMEAGANRSPSETTITSLEGTLHYSE